MLARRARLAITERPACTRPSRDRRSMHGRERALVYGFDTLLSLLVAATGCETDLGG